MTNWQIEQSSLGRIAVPRNLPRGLAVFCTSSDFEGRLHEGAVDALVRLLRERFALECTLASCGQIHRATVATAARVPERWRETPDCDALVSIDDRVALAIKIADCLPVALFDTEGPGVANVHSGWRGSAARVVPAALARMTELHGTRPGSLRVWLGPSIRGCCFEVGEEVVEAISLAYGDAEPFVDRSRGPRPHVDLTGLTISVLERAGVDQSAIDDSGLCTLCEGSIFHSFRRDGERSGRNLMIIGAAPGSAS